MVRFLAQHGGKENTVCHISAGSWAKNIGSYDLKRKEEEELMSWTGPKKKVQKAVTLLLLTLGLAAGSLATSVPSAEAYWVHRCHRVRHHHHWVRECRRYWHPRHHRPYYPR
jgi:hypothetical protein